MKTDRKEWVTDVPSSTYARGTLSKIRGPQKIWIFGLCRTPLDGSLWRGLATRK